MNKVSKALGVSFIINFILSLIKIITGFIGKSGALIADGVHSFSDLITDVIGIIGSIFSKKPSDEKHPFGHGKIEYLISIFIGLVILLIGFLIIHNSINRKVIVPSLIVIIIIIFTIIIKFLLANFLVKQGYKLNSNILISSGKESSADVISSIVVLISSLLMQINIAIFKYADIIAGILVGIFILKVGISILKENISNILGEQETDEQFLNDVKKIILKDKNIIRIKDLIILKYGPYHKLILIISMLPNITIMEACDVLNKIEAEIKYKFNSIDYISISLYN